MTPLVPLLVAGFTETALATMAPFPLAIPLAWAGAATTWVAVAYIAGEPRLLGKTVAPRMATMALFPYSLFARSTALVLKRVFPTEKAEIVPGLWVGGWPRKGAPGFAQMDVTAELPRRGEAERYRCVPMLDGAPPSVEAFEAAVEQVVAWRREGLPVLVHCAHGRGRSVAVCIGVLLAEGHARSWQEAEEIVRKARPEAHLTREQKAMLGLLKPASGAEARLSPSPTL